MTWLSQFFWMFTGNIISSKCVIYVWVKPQWVIMFCRFGVNGHIWNYEKSIQAHAFFVSSEFHTLVPVWVPELALGVGDGQGSLAYCSPWGRNESDMTELNWTAPVCGPHCILLHVCYLLPCMSSLLPVFFHNRVEGSTVTYLVLYSVWALAQILAHCKFSINASMSWADRKGLSFSILW